MWTIKHCPYCGKSFDGRPAAGQVASNAVYCSIDCRFDAKVGPDGRWIGAFSAKGHGAFWDGRSLVGAHVWALERHLGRKLLPGMWALHTNDDPACVDPQFLYEGTRRQNTDDMVDRGRSARGDANGSRLYPELRPRGEANRRAKLATEDVRAIRDGFSGGETVASLARRFSVDWSTIRAVIDRKTWAHVA